MIARSASTCLKRSLPKTRRLGATRSKAKAGFEGNRNTHSPADTHAAKKSAKAELHSSSRTDQSVAATEYVAAHQVLPSSNVPTPSRKELKELFISASIPMIGFGFMDQWIMIQAGSYIDATLGVTFGLATLTAAAMGQVVSDTSGVVFGGTIERVLNKLNLAKAPNVTAAQRQLATCRNVTMAGSVAGIILGCILGATSLLFVDLEVHDRMKRSAELRDVVISMLSTSTGVGDEADDAKVGLPCEECTIYLIASTGFAPTPEDTSTGVNGGPQVRLMDRVDRDSLAARCLHSGRTIVDNQHGSRDSILLAPITTPEQGILGVVKFRNKLTVDARFLDEDVLLAKVMARHLGIFIERLSND